MDVIQTVELFAGVGGFRLGLERASGAFRFVWADQWEPAMQEQYAFDCYEKRFGHAPQHICQDIAKVKQNVPDHDLLVGGFPCQDYSIMKKNARGIEGPKGALWWQIDAILQEKRPPYVLLENVDRILRSPAKQYGRDFSIILRSFYDKSYAVEWRVINAADYGGAQRRRRSFIVAYHASTQRFRDLAEGTCIHGLKYLHRYCMRRSILAEAFPILSHSRTYTESWIDEMMYQDIPWPRLFRRCATPIDPCAAITVCFGEWPGRRALFPACRRSAAVDICQRRQTGTAKKAGWRNIHLLRRCRSFPGSIGSACPDAGHFGRADRTHITCHHRPLYRAFAHADSYGMRKAERLPGWLDGYRDARKDALFLHGERVGRAARTKDRYHPCKGYPVKRCRSFTFRADHLNGIDDAVLHPARVGPTIVL